MTDGNSDFVGVVEQFYWHAKRIDPVCLPMRASICSLYFTHGCTLKLKRARVAYSFSDDGGIAIGNLFRAIGKLVWHLLQANSELGGHRLHSSSHLAHKLLT